MATGEAVLTPFWLTTAEGSFPCVCQEAHQSSMLFVLSKELNVQSAISARLEDKCSTEPESWGSNPRQNTVWWMSGVESLGLFASLWWVPWFEEHVHRGRRIVLINKIAHWWSDVDTYGSVVCVERQIVLFEVWCHLRCALLILMSAMVCRACPQRQMNCAHK